MRVKQIGLYRFAVLFDPRQHPLDDPERYLHLSLDTQEQLQQWIRKRLKPAKTPWWERSSYGLKHDFEQDTGIYVDNGQFKGAMLAAGYEPLDKELVNWVFRARFRR